MPKVSVIIPAYNAMAFLPETVESVLKQTFTDLELIIVNDGSTDSIVQWFAELRDPHARLVSQENQGVSAARNTGLANAQGEYIAFLDADDVWKPTKLEKQVYCLDNNPEVGLVYTWTAFINENGQSIGKVLAPDAEGNVLAQMLENDVITSGSSAMVRYSCFELVGGFDQELNGVEDRDMWIRIAAHYPFAVVKEPLTLYRRHSTNATRDHKKIIHSLKQALEKGFQANPELMHLKERSYGWLYLYQAWSCMEQKQWKEALQLRRQAISYYPRLRYTDYCLRLTLAIALMSWVQPEGYDRIRTLYRTLRSKVSSLIV